MIDWMAFVTVFVAALGSAVFVVALYSLGIRFLAIPSKVPTTDGTAPQEGPARDDEEDDIEEVPHPLWAKIAANACFGLSILAAGVGIFLIIPALHFW